MINPANQSLRLSRLSRKWAIAACGSAIDVAASAVSAAIDSNVATTRHTSKSTRRTNESGWFASARKLPSCPNSTPTAKSRAAMLETSRGSSGSIVAERRQATRRRRTWGGNVPAESISATRRCTAQPGRGCPIRPRPPIPANRSNLQSSASCRHVDPTLTFSNNHFRSMRLRSALLILDGPRKAR